MMIFSTPSLSVTLAPSGITAINFMGKLVTTTPTAGAPAQLLSSAPGAFLPVAGTAQIGAALYSALIGKPPTVTLAVNYQNLQSSTRYSFSPSGNDLLIAVTLVNSGILPFTNFAYGLPSFAFGPAVAGQMLSVSQNNLQNNAASYFHPGWWNPLAVAFAQDGTYGLALHSKSHFGKPSVFNAFVQTAGKPPQVADMTFYVVDTVLPGESLLIDMTLHFSVKCDLASVTASYVSDFQVWETGQ